MSEWCVSHLEVLHIHDKADKQTKQEYGSECKVSPPFHLATTLANGRVETDVRSVTDLSQHSDGTLETDRDSRRRKSVRLVQRLKGFVRLVYLICESAFFIFTYSPIAEAEGGLS